jgi:heat shock protein HslJ
MTRISMASTMATVAVTVTSILLAGCANMDRPSPRRAPDIPDTPTKSAPAYEARGHEPGWTLAITDSDIHYIGDYGETDIRQPNRSVAHQAGRTRYDTPRVSVVITHELCSDSMVERQYRDRVSVTANGKTVTGCGGAVVPPASLNNTSWQIDQIYGVPPLADTPTQLQFTDGRISGTAGCNRLMGSYTQADASLTLGPIASTRMACPSSLMQQEQQVIAALGRVRHWEFSSDGLLLLHDKKDILLRLRQTF